jgi:hypothetical protein
VLFLQNGLTTVQRSYYQPTVGQLCGGFTCLLL